MALTAPVPVPSPRPARPRGRSKVAVLFTSPATVLDDIRRLMHLADVASALDPQAPVGLKINITWQTYFPGCSTTPWQLEGVIRTLLELGYPPAALLGIHNRTVVVDSKVGEVTNKHRPVLEKLGIGWVHTWEPGVQWVTYEPRSPLLVLDRVFPQGLRLPALLLGRNMVHLPTLKTHVFTGTTGAMKNAFGGLLHDQRHWTHRVIHETLVDLLAIQQEIHPGLFAVMDGTISGDGPGPRALRPHLTNVLLASADQVAIDAVAAQLMGFDPLSLKYIRLATERGLGCGEVRELELVGDDIQGVSFGFRGQQDTLASRGQKLIYWGPLQPLEHLLLRSRLAPWAYAASRLYYDGFWYPLIGRRRVQQMLHSPWGQLFQHYPL